MITSKYSELKVLVIGGDTTNWTAKERPIEQTLLTGIETWVYAFNGTYQPILDTTLSDLKNFDIIIGNSNLGKELNKSIYLAENRPANVKWITLVEGNASEYLTPHLQITKLFESSDLINCININSVSFFKALTKTKVEYLGMPYPVDLISKYRVDIDKRKRESLVCTALLKRINDVLTAKGIGLPYTIHERLLSRKMKNLKHFVKYRTLSKDILHRKTIEYHNDSNMKVRSVLPISEHFQKNNAYLLWINMDDRYTWGRYVLDAAALQIPIITTKSTGHAISLFPETCLDNEFEIDKAIEIGKRLASDKDFYRYVAQYPSDKLDHFSDEMMIKKLLTALG